MSILMRHLPPRIRIRKEADQQQQQQLSTRYNQETGQQIIIMKYLTLLSLIAPLAAAAPLEAHADPALATPNVAPSSVRVVGVSLLGSGCPAGTADVQIDGTHTSLPMLLTQTPPPPKKTLFTVV